MPPRATADPSNRTGKRPVAPLKGRPKATSQANGKDNKPIAAVERALQVLSAFRGPSKLSLSELSKRTGLFKSTLLRILGTLERHGYITRLGDGQYRVGGILFELGSSYVASFQLEDVMKPALAALAAKTGESAAFYVHCGTRRQCVFRVDSPQTVRHVIVAGQILDLDRAATSLILRHYETERSRPAADVNYATLCIATSGIGDSQTASVAAPIFDSNGFLGVMNVSGPVSRFTPASVTQITKSLAEAALRMSGSLGGLLQRN